jgi:hypothetical protein
VILAPPQCDVSFVRGAKPQCWIVSEKVVSVLVGAGFKRTGFREVKIESKASGIFFELVAEPTIHHVATKNPPRKPHGWTCKDCGRISFHAFHSSIPASVFDYLCRSDLKARMSKGFLAGGSFRRTVCLSAATLRRLKETPRIRGISATRVAVLDNEEVDRSPKVKILKRGDIS